MSPDMHHLVVGRFGVVGHEAWRKAQQRRRWRSRRQRIVRFTWRPVVLVAIVVTLARWGWF